MGMHSVMPYPGKMAQSNVWAKDFLKMLYKHIFHYLNFLAIRLRQTNSTLSLGIIVPAIAYASCTGEEMGLPYIDQLPELPDEAMVERLSRGEWAVQCDDPWQFCIVRVPVFVWVVSQNLTDPELSSDDTPALSKVGFGAF